MSARLVLLPVGHPSNLALEAFACDESDHAVSAHLGGCAACRDYVVQIILSAYATQAWHLAADTRQNREIS